MQRKWRAWAVFKNSTYNTLHDVELKLEEYLKNMDKETVKSITFFNWIKNDIC
jgi:hypothetical protein